MTKRKTIDPKRRAAAREAEARANSEANWMSPAAMRETIESVIIAFVLAFLFRTFEAEAFVIPTGSMAPTLMGRHKEVECPMCHYRYQANASDKSDGNGAAPPIVSTQCPMCRYEAKLGPGNPQRESYESFDGDRILVAKFPYEFADPQRWDVVVFKYPGNSTMNYIKRLVGLPGETLRIQNGDLWVHEPGDPAGEFHIARKPPAKILAMLQPVYDNDLAPTITGLLHWPARWTAEPGPKDYAWAEGKDLSAFETKGSGKGETWIRYRHRVPGKDQWKQALNDSAKKVPGGDDQPHWMELLRANMPAKESVSPRLVSDFTAYNTARTEPGPTTMVPPGNGLHWVGDLAVQFSLEARGASGKVTAELVKGGRHFQCRFDLAANKAELAIGGGGAEAEKFHPTAAAALASGGPHTVIYSNVDDELRLWIDGSVVNFDGPTTYDSAKLDDHIPTADDLAPVGIGAEGAAATVSHIRVLRDIYYIADSRYSLPSATRRKYPTNEQPLTDFTMRYPNLSDPTDWQTDFATGPDGNMWTVEVSLAPPNPKDPSKDQFFVLGDNSAFSEDGRLWSTSPTWHGGKRQCWVDRELFIGKALFIYWPHGWPIPYVPLPFNPVPNFGRMHLVR